MQAVVIEGTEDVENMGGAFRVPVVRRGAHTLDLIMTRDVAALLIAGLMSRMEEDDNRPSNVVAFAPEPKKRGGKV